MEALCRCPAVFTYGFAASLCLSAVVCLFPEPRFSVFSAVQGAGSASARTTDSAFQVQGAASGARVQAQAAVPLVPGRKRSSAEFPFCAKKGSDEPIFYDYVDHELINQTGRNLPQVTEAQYRSEVFLRRNTTLLRRFLRAVWEGESAAVIVFGGSEAAGFQCTQKGYNAVQCSWSGRLHKWLQNASGNSRLQFMNVARGGTTSVSTLPVVRFMLQEILRGSGARHHLVMFDFGVNDAYESRDVGRYRMSVEQVIGQAVEHLFVQVWDVLPSAAIVMLDYPTALHKTPTAAYERVSSAYGVPSIPLYKHKRILGLHVAAREHAWIGNVIAHGLGGLVCEALDDVQGNDPTEEWRKRPQAGHSEQFLEPERAARMPICQNPLSSYSAYSYDRPTRMEGNCSLFEDRKAKPGYICMDGKRESVLAFNLTFGSKPRLLISHLRSYRGIGTIAASMVGVGITNMLSGRNYVNASQTYVAFFDADYGGSQNHGDGIGHQGFGVRPHSNRTLLLRSTGGKIKVVSVISC